MMKRIDISSKKKLSGQISTSFVTAKHYLTDIFTKETSTIAFEFTVSKLCSNLWESVSNSNKEYVQIHRIQFVLVNVLCMLVRE